MPNTRGGIRWRWLEYRCLLGTTPLNRKFITCFRILAWIYVIVTFRPVLRLKDKEQTTVKFTNRKDCLRILRSKRQLKGFDSAAVDLPEGTKIFVNESLCPYYRQIWNKCKKLREKQEVHLLHNKWFNSLTN